MRLTLPGGLHRAEDVALGVLEVGEGADVLELLAIDDLAAVEAAVPEAGGEQVVDRQELENVGSFAYFKDTEGNIFGAMQSAR